MQSSPRIEELRQKFHENPRRYFAPLANEYRKAGDPEQAIAICRAHLAQQPGHMSGHVVYGQALYDARRIDEATMVFHQALALDPENVIVLRHLGDIARQRGDVDEARSWYSRALDGDPHDAEVAAYLAELTEPLTTAPQAEPETQLPLYDVPRTEAPIDAEAETAPEPESERAGVEAEALEAAEDEGLAPIEGEVQPYVAPEPSAELAPAPEREIESEVEHVSEGADEAPHHEDSLVSPYAREMEFAAPTELKWDLNESPYLELVESSASDDAWNSLQAEPGAGDATTDSDEVEARDQPVTSTDAAAEVEAQPSASGSESVEPQTPAAAAEPVPQAPARRTPSRATPVTESAPIVTRTLAELYLQQGYIEPALEIYRELAEREPEDAGLQARIDEIMIDTATEPAVVTQDHSLGGPAIEASSEGGASGAAEAEGASESAVSEEREPAEMSEPSEASEPSEVTEPSEVSRAFEVNEPADQLWDSADSWGDWPFADTEDREELFGLPEDVEAAATDAEDAPVTVEENEPAPEIEEARPFSVAAPITVREFFATLGSIRPPSRETDVTEGATHATSELDEPAASEQSGPTHAEEEYPMADDAFASLFAGVPVDAEDSRAAAVLSGAVAHGAPFSTPLTSPPSPPPREPQQSRSSAEPAQESEEDIRRFREWLDGLSGS